MPSTVHNVIHACFPPLMGDWQFLDPPEAGSLVSKCSRVCLACGTHAGTGPHGGQLLVNYTHSMWYVYMVHGMPTPHATHKRSRAYLSAARDGTTVSQLASSELPVCADKNHCSIIFASSITVTNLLANKGDSRSQL